VNHFPLGNSEVVGLMMGATREYPDEAEATNMLHLLRVAGRDREQFAIR
jgi:hypothetical protein